MTLSVAVETENRMQNPALPYLNVNQQPHNNLRWIAPLNSKEEIGVGDRCESACRGL